MHASAFLLLLDRFLQFPRLPGLLHIASDLLLLGRVRMLPHSPQRALEEVVHRLDRPALHFRKAEEDENHAEVCEHCIQQESAVAHLGDHVGCCARDAVVDDPVDEEAEGHAERALERCISRLRMISATIVTALTLTILVGKISAATT